MSRIVAIIPARMGSTRFPGKPLALIHGRPMIEYVYRGTAACRDLDEVVIATCDREIADAARGFGARVAMTSGAHERASDRVAEAVRHDAADIVVMVQGDEPMVQAGMVSAAIAPLLADPAAGCVNLAAPIRSAEEFLDPNTIKVVAGGDGRALYFSRAPIPYTRPGVATAWRKQVCVIAFRREALTRFTSLPQGPLEQIESVDMLRFLEHGLPVHLAPATADTHAVDSPHDLALVASRLGPVGVAR